MVRDPDCGKYRRTRLFVLTLGYSRKAVRLLVRRSSAQVWAQTARAGVSAAGRHRTRRRARQPQGGRPHARHLRPHAQSALPRRAGPLRGRRPAVSRPRSRSQGQGRSRRRPRPEDAVARPPLRAPRRRPDLPRPLGAALGRHPHPRHDQAPGRRHVRRGTPGPRSVAARAAPLLPVRPPHRASGRLRRGRVGLLRGAAGLDRPARPRPVERSSRPAARPPHRPAPPEHLRAPRGWHRIEDRDRPARTPPKTLALLAAAKRAGPAISTICDHIHRHDGAAGVRRILGVLSLARKHGPAVAEEAATAALELGVPTYRFLRRYLDRRPEAPLSLRQVDPLIRELTLYRDLIDRRTGDPS